jgi:hypothetical protein
MASSLVKDRPSCIRRLRVCRPHNGAVTIWFAVDAYSSVNFVAERRVHREASAVDAGSGGCRRDRGDVAGRAPMRSSTCEPAVTGGLHRRSHHQRHKSCRNDGCAHAKCCTHHDQILSEVRQGYTERPAHSISGHRERGGMDAPGCRNCWTLSKRTASGRARDAGWFLRGNYADGKQSAQP